MKYNQMKKYKKIKCCPYGYLRDESVVDCYYFGIITYYFCENCDVRKRQEINCKND